MTGPLSNRLYQLDELNRRERRAREAQANALLAIVLGLCFFIALAAIVRMHG